MSRNATRDDSRIGDFALDAEIGKGSFATVYRGYRLQTKDPVAIKVVTRKKLTPKLLDNLEGEIAILKAINHPNIVELKECLKTDSHIYLVMAFCAAGDLSQYIKKRYDIPSATEAPAPGQPLVLTKRPNTRLPHPVDGGLNETIVRSILTQLTAALEFMRGRDIVHRDIKPQNLLLQPPDHDFVALGNPPDVPQVKVADFGFARHLSNNVLAETLCGSPLYMAPEILRYEKYDAKADLWSTGAVLYEMSVGKPPFKASNHVELLRRIEKGEDRIKFPDERSAGSLAREAARREEAGEPPLPPPHLVSADLKALIRQLLRRKPVERMSFEEFFRNSVIEDYKAQICANRVAAGGDQPQDEPSHAKLESSASSALGSSSEPVASHQRRSSTSTPEGDKSPKTVRPALHARTSSGAGSNRSVDHGPTGQSQMAATSKASHQTPPKAFAAKYIVGDALSAIRKDPSSATAGSDGPPEQVGLTSSPSRRAADPPVRSVSDPSEAGSSSVPPGQREGSPSNEDSMLGKEYVMIEKRNVEVNALADELAASPQNRPSTVARRPSRLARLGSGFPAVAGESSPIRISSTPPGGVWPTPAPFALPPGARPSSFPRRTSLSSSGSPSPRLMSQAIPPAGGDPTGTSPLNVRRDRMSDSPNDDAAAIANARPAISGASPGSGSSPTSALARAISMASLRLFGVPSGMSLRGAAALVRSRSARRAAFLRSSDGSSDSAEVALLATLEDLGQKSFVLSEFADSKLAAFFPVGPHQSTTDLDASARRLSSTSSSMMDAETAAAEALVLYVKALSFLQRGINATKAFLDARGPGAASADLNELVQWHRARFNEGYDKADFARSKCGEIPESAAHVDRLIFDKALEVARAAAMDELENNRDGWDCNHCLLAYETAQSMLNALLDPGEEGLALSDGSIGTIEKFVKSISKRIAAMQSKGVSV